MNNKRKLNTAAPPPSRRLRSNLPRRRRQRFSPLLRDLKSFHAPPNVDDSSSLLSLCEVPTSKKRIPVELSDCLCGLSYSATEASRRNGAKKEVEFEFAEIEDSREVAKSGISCVSKLSEGTSKFAGSVVVSTNSVMSNSVKQPEKNAKFCDENDECEVESAVKSEVSTVGIEKRKTKKSENVSVNFAENDIVSVDSVKLNAEETESAVDGGVERSFPETIVTEFDLECSENFPDESFENSSQQSHSYSSAYSSIYFESSEWENLSEEFTPSTWFDSGSQFSEKSSPDAAPCLTFQLLNQFSEQFHKTSLLEDSSRKRVINDYSDDINLLGLEDEEQEESFRMFKSRERRQFYLRDYAAEYCSSDYGQLIIEQRLEMVHWIFEQSTNKELQNETMFLGINLLDRFLSKGYFKTKRSLQIAGISCLTLATRIEENQPYNCVRQKTFYVGNTAYTRCEVVAMEWLVQEVLNFQCFLPTMYNFLWFYLKAARANDAVEKTVRYLATLALLGHDQMCYWPSTVAASLVIIACKAAETDAHCHLLIESHSREKDDTLPECIKRLEFLVKYC